jgi:hypothetical protein
MKWRRGQESNLPRLLRTDNGFEDREGHQAPFTLQRERKGPTLNVQHPTPNERRRKSLLCLFDRADDGVEVWPVARFEFGVEQFSISANFESAAARRNESERFNALAEFENFGRQTDGLRRVVSNDAVFDRYFGFHSCSFPSEKVNDAPKHGQGARSYAMFAPRPAAGRTGSDAQIVL